MVLQLHFVRFAELQDRRILDFDFYNRNVFAFPDRRAESFDLEWKIAAVGRNHMVNMGKAGQPRFSQDLLNQSTLVEDFGGIAAIVASQLLNEIRENSFFTFV